MNLRTLRRVALNVALDPTDKTPPKEFRLFALGPFGSTKGGYTFDERSAELVMAENETYGNDRSSDYEHQSLQVPPIEAPASSWFDLDLRDDGLYAANIRWTENADKRLRSGEYRYFSPAFYADEDGRITGFVNFALTNNPATFDQEPLVAASATHPTGANGAGEAPMKTLLTLLALAPTATEADGAVAINALKSSEEAAKRRAGDLEREVIALTGAASIDDARGRLVGLKAAADQVTALTTKVAQLEGEKVGAQVDALIAQGEAEGKITPATKPMLLAMGKANPESLRGFLAVAPRVVALGALKEPTEGTKATDGKTADAPVVTLTAEDKVVAKRLNISEKDFAASKAATLQVHTAS